MSEKRFFVPNPKWIHTLKPGIAEWAGREVTVSSWHELYSKTETAKMFPDDEIVGFVEEFAADIPKSELLIFLPAQSKEVVADTENKEEL